jgi:hypothetical protein
MKAFEFVLSEIQKSGAIFNGKQRELIVRRFKRDRVEMGLRRAQEALADTLQSVASKQEPLTSKLEGNG